jgi:hypothetical protein
LALTFVNQVGAVEGMNQAAPGTLIPESFVRWSQDVLFDRAGLMRRRGAFEGIEFFNKAFSTGIASIAAASGGSQEITLDSAYYINAGMLYKGMKINVQNSSSVTQSNGNDLIITAVNNATPSITVTNAPSGALTTAGVSTWLVSSSSRTYPCDPTTLLDTVTHNNYPNTYNEKVVALGSTYDPNGDVCIGMISNLYTAANAYVMTVLRFFDYEFQFLGYSTIVEIPNLSTTSIKAALGGGSWLSFSDDPANPENHVQYFWRGGSGSPVTKTGCSFNRETPAGFGGVHYSYSRNLTLSDTVGVSPGMFVYYVDGSGNNWYMGVVKTILNSTTIILEKYPYFAATSGTPNTLVDNTDLSASITGASLYFTPIRAYDKVHGRGLLTSIATSGANQTISSGDLGTSAEGHWSSAGVVYRSSNQWGIYRASDNAYLGYIGTGTISNIQATISKHPGIVINADEYIMREHYPTTISNNTNTSEAVVENREKYDFGGLYTAVYSGLQWYGNYAKDDAENNRVVFSASHNLEAVDLSKDSADSIVFPGKSQFRGIAASSSGLLVFLEDRVYILRGNDRSNFSVEQLVPEGCLSPSSIVEYGGGVFWAGKSGIMYYDGASVRNLTSNNLGVYYTDSLDLFNPVTDRVYGFIHKNNLMMYYTRWRSPYNAVKYEPIYAADWQNTEGIQGRNWDDFDPDFDYDDFFTENNTPIFWDKQTLNSTEDSGDTGQQGTWETAGVSGFAWATDSNTYRWGPLREDTGLLLSIYLPTGAITTLSNLWFSGSTNIETIFGLKSLFAVNSVESAKTRARMLDLHPVYDLASIGDDAYTIQRIGYDDADLIVGPDFYLQTKQYTVGDPVLRKWFQRILLNMLLYDGALRLDLVDEDDNDEVDINKKKHKNWEIFTEKGYSWNYLTDVQFPKLVSPNKNSWKRVEETDTLWMSLFLSDFNRYAKRISWRKGSIGFRLYQLNEYKKPFNGVVTRPNRVDVQAFSIGFKPLRAGRI